MCMCVVRVAIFTTGFYSPIDIICTESAKRGPGGLFPPGDVIKNKIPTYIYIEINFDYVTDVIR